MHNIIIMALRNEAPVLATRNNVFFCGIGKVNAAAMTAQLIERYQPRQIINFGTAGGITVGAGLHQATRFVQRDMRCTALGAAPGQTPFESDVMIDLGTDGLICSTGDNFVSDNQLDIPADLVDMEAYAMAKVCERSGVEFLCWKFVTDQADAGAAQDWQELVSAGESWYQEKLRELGL